MLRITADADARQLILAGSLSGIWVDTLEDSWRTATTRHAPRQVSIDLTDVSFVDTRGKHLLQKIHRAGGGLCAAGMNAALIQEIHDGIPS